MASDAVGVVSENPGSLLSKISGKTSTPEASLRDSEPHFRDEWRTLTEKLEARRSVVAVDERLRGDLFEGVLALALRYPNLVEVSSNPVDEREPDMVDHVQGHFDSAFNNEGFAPVHSVRTPSNFETLIRACEVVYIDDAVLRFVPRWTFEPVFDDLDTLRFTELPDRLGQWMGQVQLMWDGFAGLADVSSKQLDGLVQTLYSSRTEFVETAMKEDTLLPVPATDYDPATSGPDLETKFIRQHEIAPEDVHEYCYRRVLDEF